MDINISSITHPAISGEMGPREIAGHVQAMFMEVLIKSMEETVQADGGLYGDSSTSDIYRGMLRQEMAIAMSQDLGGPLVQQLEKAIRDRATDVQVPGVGVSSERSVGQTLPVQGRVTSPAGWRQDPITGEARYHRGTDIAAPNGTPIQSVSSGRVVESGRKGGYGNAVVIESDDGRKMLYAHNLMNHVKVGDRVRAGEVIALVGSTGRSTGPHVHFEVTE